jgi:predicted ATPase/DNA-binding SARP family transcriptional activator
MADALHIELLGGLRVTLGDTPVSGFVSSKVPALLCYLAVTGRPHFRPALAALLWGELPDADAAANLRQALANLRRLLEPHLLITRQTVAFNAAAPYSLDTQSFERELAALGKLEDAHAALALPSADLLDALQRAVDRYAGDFLAGLRVRDAPTFEEWMLAQQERLRELAQRALHVLATQHAARGEYSAAIASVTRLLALDPWREEAHRQLMLLLARNGQRAAALTQYEVCRRVLRDELGVEPMPETTALYERIRTALPAGRSAVPIAPTVLVGREAERADLARRLADPACRLVTIGGPGGIGKTRLALQTAADLGERFLHGVCVVQLASVGRAGLLAAAIANALQLVLSGRAPPQAQLFNYLREKELLLVLDNFEHLIEGGADLLAEIIWQAPEVKLLVTSRERLRVQGEWLLELGGLAYPDDRRREPRTTQRVPDRAPQTGDVSRVTSDVTPDTRHPAPGTSVDLEQYSAVELFIQRARSVYAGFAPSPADMRAVVRICRLVEGMPLGIELAAAWVRVLACEEIAQELERNLGFLSTSLRDAPERHGSMRAVFDYSWQFLSAEERRVLRRLSVFRAGFTRAAAAGVLSFELRVMSWEHHTLKLETQDSELLTLLASLIDKSLLRKVEAGRYELHELIRQYAAEKLAESPEERAQTYERHCAYYTHLLQQQEQALAGAMQKQAIELIDAEIENVRVAWQWAAANGRHDLIGMALEGLYLFYERRSWFQEGADAFGQAVERFDGDEAALETAAAELTLTLGRLIVRQGVFSTRLSLFKPSRELLRRGLTLLRRHPAHADVALALTFLGTAAWALGEFGEARRCCEQSLALCRATNDRRGQAQALNMLGAVANTLGEYADARRLHQESLVIRRAIDDRRGIAVTLNNLANAAWELGEYDEAERCYQESLAVYRQLGDRSGIANTLLNVADIARLRGTYAEAQQMFQECLAMFRATGERYGMAYALSYQGNVVGLLGDYSRARGLLDESLALYREIGSQEGIATTLGYLGEVACASGSLSQAREYFCEALRIAIESESRPAALLNVVGMAELLIRQGRAEQAAELLAHPLSHPASDNYTRDRASRLRVDLEAALSPESVGAALARGQPRPFDDVVAALLDQPIGT